MHPLHLHQHASRSTCQIFMSALGWERHLDAERTKDRKGSLTGFNWFQHRKGIKATFSTFCCPLGEIGKIFLQATCSTEDELSQHYTSDSRGADHKQKNAK